MMTDKQYLTKEKHKDLTEELDLLRRVKRKEIAEQLEAARSLGDLSENAEYQEAREEQGKIETRILHLEEVLRRAEILKHKQTDTAEMGSIVTVQKVKEGDKSTYEIVGTEDADVLKNKISYQSPLGSSLIGKRKGEAFIFETPRGKVEYKVLKVE